MMSNFDLLDRYFSNTLDKSEIKTFNERLKTDPDFNREFQEIKEIKLAVKVEARKNIKSLFTDIEDSLNHQELTNNNQTAMKRMLTVAASLILMVSVSYFVLNGGGQPSPQDVFTEYYEPFNNLNGQVRGETIDNESLSAAAFNAYDAGDFALAAESFKALVEVEKTAAHYFYMGIANIEIGDTKEAVKSFNIVLNNFKTFKDQSLWYISMANLADESALSTLALLASKTGTYQVKSKEVLSKLGYEASFLSTSSTGNTDEVELDPSNIDVPDGSTDSFIGERQIQYGVISDIYNGKRYKFMTDSPIRGLGPGDLVEFVILKDAKGKRGMGFAFILNHTK